MARRPTAVVRFLGEARDVRISLMISGLGRSGTGRGADDGEEEKQKKAKHD